MKNVLVTQRVCLVPEINEVRDCLAHDWYPFLQALGVVPVAVPNHLETALTLVKTMDVGGLVLTGGNDVGSCPERDATELALLDWCEQADIPAIGVCRGFQMMAHWCGAELTPVDPETHRAKRHMVALNDGSRREVNSFHNFGVGETGIERKGFRPFARCEKDGSLEGMTSKKDLAIMWHPEREKTPDPTDIALFRQYLGIKA